MGLSWIFLFLLHFRENAKDFFFFKPAKFTSGFGPETDSKNRRQCPPLQSRRSLGLPAPRFETARQIPEQRMLTDGRRRKVFL